MDAILTVNAGSSSLKFQPVRVEGRALAAEIRGQIDGIGATLDPEANEAGGPRISAAGSLVPVFVIPTDEELMIARHTLALVGGLALA